MTRILSYLFLLSLIGLVSVVIFELYPTYKEIDSQNVELSEKLVVLTQKIDSVNKKSSAIITDTKQVLTSIRLEIKYINVDSILLVDSISHITADNHLMTVDSYMPIDSTYFQCAPPGKNNWEIVLKSFNTIPQAFLFSRSIMNNRSIEAHVLYVGSLKKYFVCYDYSAKYSSLAEATVIYSELVENKKINLESILVIGRVFDSTFDDTFN